MPWVIIIEIPFIQNFPSCPFFGNLLVTCFNTFLSRVVLRVALISPQHLLAPPNGHMLLLSAYALFFQTNHSVKNEYMVICCLTIYLLMNSSICFDTMRWQWRIQRGFTWTPSHPPPTPFLIFFQTNRALNGKYMYIVYINHVAQDANNKQNNSFQITLCWNLSLE